MFVILLSSLTTAIAPSFKLLFLSGIIKSSSILYFTPSPLHSGQAPHGALNENILGSNVGSEKLQCGQAYVSLRSILSPSITSIITFPFPNFVAISILSYSLLLISCFIINLSIITSIVCFLFFSNSISSARSCSSPSINALTYPSVFRLSIVSLCVPFSRATTGDNTLIFVPSFNSKTSFTVSSID